MHAQTNREEEGEKTSQTILSKRPTFTADGELWRIAHGHVSVALLVRVCVCCLTLNRLIVDGGYLLFLLHDFVGEGAHE